MLLDSKADRGEIERQSGESISDSPKRGKTIHSGVYVPRKSPNRHGHRTVYTYAWLYMAASRALLQAEEVSGSGYNHMLAVLATAFCIEAYMNHLGAKIIVGWETLEKDLTPKERLKLLCKQLSVPLDHTTAQYRAFLELFRTRNALVHGKTTRMYGKWHESDYQAPAPRQLLTPWERTCEPPRSRQLLAHAEAVIEMLHRANGGKASPFYSLSEGSSTGIERIP